MLFSRQEPDGSPLSQENFSCVEQQVKWGKPRIWVLLVPVLLVGFSSGFFIGGGKTQASSFVKNQTITRTFPVGAQPDLSITNTDAGFIHVYTGSDDTVVIMAKIKSMTDILPTVNFANPDSTHIIVTVTDDSPKNAANLNKVDFDVIVPAHTDLDLSASAGDITVIDGIQGTGHLQTSAGNISLASTTLIGSGSIKASAGTITFAGSIADGASYQFLGNTGNITVTLPSNTDCHVEARTTVGSIQSDFSEIHIHNTGVTSQEAEGDIGNGNPSASISLITGAGSIAIDERAS